MAKKETKTTKKVNKKEDKVENNTTTWKNVIELIAIIIAIIIILVFFKGSVIWNIVILLLMLSVLIFVHEGGHFLMGKKFGVHIYEFSLGMGPKILGFKRKNDPTEYTLRALPIGGFCGMAGEEGEDDANLSSYEFMCNKKKIPRIIILCAGVVMNFITALVLLFFIALIWGSTEQASIIGVVAEDSPAEEAGLVAGDRIIECNGRKVRTWDKLTVITALKNTNDYYEYTIEHEDGTTDTYKITPATYVTIGDEQIKVTDDYTLDDILEEYNVTEDEAETSKLIGIGAGSKRYYGVLASIKYAFVKFADIVIMMLMIIGSLLTGKLGLSALSGPVGMYTIVGTAASYGIANIIYLAAYLSINLGVINILPFPAFDGGRVLFVLIEAVTGKKVNPNVEAIFHTVGFILLMILMVYITYQDIINLEGYYMDFIEDFIDSNLFLPLLVVVLGLLALIFIWILVSNIKANRAKKEILKAKVNNSEELTKVPDVNENMETNPQEVASPVMEETPTVPEPSSNPVPEPVAPETKVEVEEPKPMDPEVFNNLKPQVNIPSTTEEAFTIPHKELQDTGEEYVIPTSKPMEEEIEETIAIKTPEAISNETGEEVDIPKKELTDEVGEPVIEIPKAKEEGD